MSRLVAFDHRDPAMRPFIEVGAKSAIAIAISGREEGTPAREVVASLAEVAAEDAALGAREMSDRLPSTRRLLPVCREGCAYCCYSTVHASSAEILRIASYVKETRSPEEVARLRERTAEAAAKVEALDLDQRAQAKVPCPLLDVASGRCSVYDVRPIPCRAYHSGDVDVCKKGFDAGDPNPILPINPALFHVAHAFGFGALAGHAASGMDPGPYDLATSLGAALDDDLDARWLAGEAVFKHTKLSAEAKIGYDLVLGELVNDLKSGRLDEAERVAKRLDPDARRKERNRRKRQNKK